MYARTGPLDERQRFRVQTVAELDLALQQRQGGIDAPQLRDRETDRRLPRGHR